MNLLQNSRERRHLAGEPCFFNHSPAGSQRSQWIGEFIRSLEMKLAVMWR